MYYIVGGTYEKADMKRKAALLEEEAPEMKKAKFAAPKRSTEKYDGDKPPRIKRRGNRGGKRGDNKASKRGSCILCFHSVNVKSSNQCGQEVPHM